MSPREHLSARSSASPRTRSTSPVARIKRSERIVTTAPSATPRSDTATAPSAPTVAAATSTPGSHSTPAAHPASTIARSSRSREITTPPRNGRRAVHPPEESASVLRGWPAPAAIASRPRRVSSFSAAGDRQHPHTLPRGRLARSTRSTRTRFRASRRAAAAPAGPAPTTTHSHGPAAAARPIVPGTVMRSVFMVPSSRRATRSRPARARPGARSHPRGRPMPTGRGTPSPSGPHGRRVAHRPAPRATGSAPS